MPLTSGTYNFQSVQIELLIREAFERLGILGEFTEVQKLDSAKRSIDLILLDWMNKKVNLWTLKSTYLPLIPNKAQYLLPISVSNIIQANLRTSTRQLNGTAISPLRQLGGTAAASSGVAANAFDGNPLTSCNQDPNQNGDISYDYGIGITYTITKVGFISQVTRDYVEIRIEESPDNVNWNPLITINPTGVFTLNQLYSYDLPVPAPYRAYRARDNGNTVFNIQELYFISEDPNPDAQNAFDGDPLTFCRNPFPNGYIAYDYGLGNTEKITFVGIQSNITTIYNIIVEWSLDNISWYPLLIIGAKTFNKDENTWFDIPIPVDARLYRIRETGGAILDIQEIYFNNNTFDFVISEVSRYEYNTFPNKYLQSRPNVYYLNRQIEPILNLWPTPSSQYNCLFYSYKQMMQDTGTFYTNTLDVPARFYPSLVWALCWQLALKYKPDMAMMFKGEYDQSFGIASIEDSENTPIRIMGDYSKGMV